MRARKGEGNPTIQQLEQKLAALEGAEACAAFGSGMAAIWALMFHQLKSGDLLVIRTGAIDRAMFKGQHRKEFTWFSIADSLPLISASAEKVARETIAGFRRGDAEVIVPLWTWFSARLYALFPGLSATAIGWFNRLLPGTGGIGTERAFGKDSHSSLSPSLLTSLSDKAARQNNEMGGQEQPDADRLGERSSYRSSLSDSEDG